MRCPEAIARLNGTRLGGVTRIVVHGYVADLAALYAGMRVRSRPFKLPQPSHTRAPHTHTHSSSKYSKCISCFSHYYAINRLFF